MWVMFMLIYSTYIYTKLIDTLQLCGYTRESACACVSELLYCYMSVRVFQECCIVT